MDNFQKIVIKTTQNYQEPKSVVIDDVEYQIDSRLPQRETYYSIQGAMICEMALLRRLIIQEYETIRMELVPKGEKFSITNISTSDGFIDPFDLINKVRMIRIPQNIAENIQLKLVKKNLTKEQMDITSNDIVCDDPNVIFFTNEVLLCRLMPGKQINLKIFTVKGTGREHATFCPTYIVTHYEDDQYSNLRQQEFYYQIDKHMLVLKNDIGLENKDILLQTIKLYTDLFADSSIHEHVILNTNSQCTEILFPKQSYHFGTVIHMTLTRLFENIVCTYTTQQTTEKGLVFRFVNPIDKEKIIKMLLETARFQRTKWLDFQLQ